MSHRVPIRRLSLAQARRVALDAQGFGRLRPLGRAVTMRDVQSLIGRLAQFQIDTISVVERAHYFPLYSRLGTYDKSLLDRALATAPRRLFEYWGHAASMIDVDLWPALQWRMARQTGDGWRAWERMVQQYPELPDQVLAEVRARGPVSARQIEFEEERSRDHWGWNWSSVKLALEMHFSAGRITAASRNQHFERLYDVPVRVLPAPVLALPALSEDDACRELVRRSARALGIASSSCLADYFRIGQTAARRAIDELVELGELVPVEVAEWQRPLWLWHQARIPRRVHARALVSPFDSLVFERNRTLALFDFFYRIEIYVPEAKRRHGYYVYPFLLDEQFVARVDLKADRANGVVIVKASWLEPGREVPAEVVARELAEELAELARWTGCSRVVVQPRGDLAEALSAAVVHPTH